MVVIQQREDSKENGGNCRWPKHGSSAERGWALPAVQQMAVKQASRQAGGLLCSG